MICAAHAAAKLNLCLLQQGVPTTALACAREMVWTAPRRAARLAAADIDRLFHTGGLVSAAMQGTLLLPEKQPT